MRMLLSGVLAAFLALSSHAPAAAGDYTHADGTGDMWTATGADPYVQAPGQVEGDVTRVQLKHNRSYVQLFMAVREARRETLNSFYFFSLQNGRKQQTLVSVSTYRRFGQPDGVLRIQDPRTNKSRTCRGFKGFRINWEAGTVGITIPRTCVGQPAVLRMRAYDHLNYDTIDDYADHAQSAGLSAPWSRWVRRG